MTEVTIDPSVAFVAWDTPEELECLIESAIFASQDALTSKSIQQLFSDLNRPSIREVETALESISNSYKNRGIKLNYTAKGYRFHIRQEYNGLVKHLLADKPPRYSRALLETLVLIAYRQPITRGEIEEVRGVSVSSHIMKTLEERSWVRVVGHKEVPGRPALWATTPDFLEYFDLQSLEALPPLAELENFGKLLPNEETKLYSPEPEPEPEPEKLVAAVELSNNNEHNAINIREQQEQQEHETLSFNETLARLRGKAIKPESSSEK